MSQHSLIDEDRWAGFREVMTMSWPIILGSMSYTVMDFSDKVMAGWLGEAALAAGPAAGLWSFTLSTLFLGVLGCAGTFVAQSLGKGEKSDCARYAWQGLYMSLAAGLATLVIWPFAGFIFDTTRVTPEARDLAIGYFQIRLIGYIPMAACTVLAAFFQAVNKAHVPMWTSIAACVLNVSLNYLLMYGKLGLPELGVNGLAAGTVIAQYVQLAMLMGVFLLRGYDLEYATRSTWRFELARVKEMLVIGGPNGLTFLLDILNWAIFTTHIVGRDGDTVLAGHNAALGLMHLAIMPAVAINQGIAAIVGQWIGRGRPDIAAARTYTAVKIAVVYMTLAGFFNAVAGEWIIRNAFVSDTPNAAEIAHVGQVLLYFAAAFEAFDAIFIVTIGALRGAGDTRWTMWATIIANYVFFLPLTVLVAIPLGGGAYGSWAAATVYVMVLSLVVLRRFRGGKWREICIFSADRGAPEPEGAATAGNAL